MVFECKNRFVHLQFPVSTSFACCAEINHPGSRSTRLWLLKMIFKQLWLTLNIKYFWTNQKPAVLLDC